MKNFKTRMKEEWGFFSHDINGLWAKDELTLSRLMGSVIASLIFSPAWILGFVLSAVGWYELEL